MSKQEGRQGFLITAYPTNAIKEGVRISESAVAAHSAGAVQDWPSMRKNCCEEGGNALPFRSGASEERRVIPLRIDDAPSSATPSQILRANKPGSVTLLPMELKERTPGVTLASKLGTPAHVSGLAIRLARRSGAGDRLPEWLLKTALDRGATHYQRDFEPALPPDNPAISDEEIGVALCLGQMPDDPWLIRAAAQLLSSPRVDPQRLARLAEMERVEPVLLHIAGACARVDPALEPWATLRRLLHPRRKVRTEVLPHWTRFAILPGLTRDGYLPPQWLRRRE